MELRGRRFTTEQRQHALLLVASGMAREQVAVTVGTTTESLRGGGFVAFSKETDFGRFLEAELIDHVVGKSYRPRGGGKVESAIGTLKRELWEVEHFDDQAHAEACLREFFEEYNERRAHMSAPPTILSASTQFAILAHRKTKVDAVADSCATFEPNPFLEYRKDLAATGAASLMFTELSSGDDLAPPRWFGPSFRATTHGAP